MVNGKTDILLIGDNSLDTVGGEQESTKIIIEGLKHEFNIGTIQPGNINKPGKNARYYELTDQTRIKHLILKPISFVKYLVGLRKVIIRERPSIIHTQAQVSFFLISILKKMRLISDDFVFIHTERGLYTKYSSFFKKIFYFSIKQLDILVTTTEFNYNYWKKALDNRHIYPEYRIIENTAGPLFEEFDESLNITSGTDFTIGFAGRYAEWKNWPLALEIIEKINVKTHQNVNVKIAVGCLDDTSLIKAKEMFEYLKNLLNDRFYGVINIDIEEMNTFYYGIDVFILTSNANTESFGRTLVEAMSRRNVALTTNSGGSVEVVGNKKNILEDSDSIIKRVMDLYGDRSLLEEEKAANFRRVKEKYSYENNCEKHLKLYSSVLKGVDK